MAKIVGLKETADVDSYSASDSISSFSEHLRESNGLLDFDAQSAGDSVSFITEPLVPPGVGNEDLRYLSVDQLYKELETAIISSLKLENARMTCVTRNEWDSLKSQKRLWDLRLSGVNAALLERVPVEREQFLQKLRDWENGELADKQKKNQEELQSHSDMTNLRSEGSTSKTPEQTDEETTARTRKQTEERIQRHCPPIPSVSQVQLTSPSGSTGTWKYLGGKLGHSNDFILGDSTKEQQENNKLNNIQPQTEERKHPIEAIVVTMNNQQSKKTDVQWLDEWRQVNPVSADDLLNAAFPSPPQVSGTHVEIGVNDPEESSTAAFDLTQSEVC